MLTCAHSDDSSYDRPRTTNNNTTTTTAGDGTGGGAGAGAGTGPAGAGGKSGDGAVVAYYELVFVATDIAPLGFQVYTIQPSGASTSQSPPAATIIHGVGGDGTATAPTVTTTTISNGVTELTFTGATLVRASSPSQSGSKHGGKFTMELHQDVVVYQSRGSGPVSSNNYQFDPTSEGVSALTASSRATVYKGSVVVQVVVQYTPTIIQRFRLVRLPAARRRKSSSSSSSSAVALGMQVLIDTSVGPLVENTEVAARFFSPEIGSDGRFWSDESGWFARNRTFNPAKQTDPLLNIAANYVPMAQFGYAQNNPNGDGGDNASSQLTLVAEHSHGLIGGTPNASLEVMLHRRLTNGWLDDNSTVSSRLVMLAASTQEAATYMHTVVAAVNNPPVLLFAAAAASATEPGPAVYGLPDAVDLLNFDLQRVNDDGSNATIMVRLAHMVAANEHTALAAAVQVNVAELFPFSSHRICAIDEKMLDGVRPRPTKPHSVDDGARAAAATVPATAIELTPLSIRTFVVTVDLK